MSLTFLRRVDLEPVISPASELHLTVLVVEGEPGDVDGAGGEEDAGGDVGAEAVGGYHHIRWVGSVKSLAGANKKQHSCKKCGFLFIVTCCTSEYQVSKVDPEAPDAKNIDHLGGISTITMKIMMIMMMRMMNDDDNDNKDEQCFTRMSLTLPYSDSFQRMLASSHSWIGSFASFG